MFFHNKQIMQQRENKPNNSLHPFGICKRLINFIMNTLTAQGLRRLTNPQPRVSNEVPVEGSSIFRLEHDFHHPENSNSEIRVDVRHVNGLRHHVAKNDNVVVNGEKGSIRSVDSGIIRPTKMVEIDSRGGQVNRRELDTLRKSPKKVASVNENGGEKVKNKNKDKNIVVAAEAEDRTMRPLRRIPFLDDDINGKADEFIRRKKQDFLRKNTTIVSPKST